MATQSRYTPREVVDFPANIPVTVALRYSEGKTISNPYGERIMYSLADGRVMFLDPEVARRIADLSINVRESFTITRKSNGQNGALISWEVARISGERRGGAGGGQAASPVLIAEANALVDAYAQVLERTLTTYQGRIKPEEARALLVSAYIQRGKFCSAA